MRGMKPKRLSAGVVVVRLFDESWRCLMLRVYRNWDFPKGEVEAGESPLGAARREVQEEAALTSLEFTWGEAFCDTAPYSGGKVARYFLAQSKAGDVSLPVNTALGRPEHHEYRWVNLDSARVLAPPRLQHVVAWASSMISQHPPPLGARNAPAA